MKIGDQVITARKMTAGDLAVIAPLIKRVRPHLKTDGKGVDVQALVDAWGDIINAAEQLLDHNQPAPSLRSLPLDEAIEVLHQLVVEWLSLNGGYVAQQVAPAVSRTAQTVALVATQAKESLEQIKQ